MDRKQIKKNETKEEEQNYKELISSIFRWIILSLIMSIPIGGIVGFYNIVLKNTNKFRENHQWLIYFLPVAGIIIIFVYLKTKKNSYSGENLLKAEVQQAAKNIPWYMAFIAFFGSFLTTLFGGSAGKEGSAIAMGGTVGDFVAQKFNLSDEFQRTLVVSGVGAAFGVIYDVPFAGGVMGMELVLKGHFHYSALIPAFLTSVFSNEVSHMIGNQEVSYPALYLQALDVWIILKLVLLGIIFGVAGFTFNLVMDSSSKIYNKITKDPYKKAVIGGVLTILLFWIAGNDYNGLGHTFIREAFEIPVGFMDAVWKLIFTAVALGSGFQGGRGNPTLFVGVSLGSWLSKFFNLPLSSCAALGMIGVFCGAASLPLTCIAMSVEYFGNGEMVAVMIVMTTSFIISGFYDIFTRKKLSKGKDEIFEGKVADSK